MGYNRRVRGTRRQEGLVTTTHDYDAILIPTLPFKKLRFADYIDQARKRKLFKGEYIDHPCTDKDDRYFYYIEKGQLKCCFENEDGAQIVLYYRNEGNAFQAEYHRFASIGKNRMKFIATKDTIVFAFTMQQLFDIVRDDFELFDELMYVVHMSFAQIGHRIGNTGIHSSSKRILTWLTKLCEVREPDAGGVYRIECNLTLQALSDILLVHITTCSKLMSALETQGVVERTKTHLLVKDYERLLAYRNEENPMLY